MQTVERLPLAFTAMPFIPLSTLASTRKRFSWCPKTTHRLAEAALAHGSPTASSHAHPKHSTPILHANHVFVFLKDNLISVEPLNARTHA